MSGRLWWIALAAAITAATLLIGWWSVPLVAAAWGLAAPRSNRPALAAGSAALAAWVVLLLWTASRGPAADLANKTGAIFGVSGAAFAALTVLFAVILAAAAAGTAVALKDLTSAETRARLRL